MPQSSHHLRTDNSGVAAIEFALILPVLLLILLGVIEFGVYFMREQVVQRTANTTISTLQRDPTDEMAQSNAYDSGAGFVDYTSGGNYICAKAYTTSAAAKSGLCSAGDWTVVGAAGSGMAPGDAYYIAFTAYVKQTSFTDMFNRFIPDIKVSSVFKVGGGSSATNDFAPGALAGYCNIISSGFVQGIHHDAINIVVAPAVATGKMSPSCGCSAGWTVITPSVLDTAIVCIKQ